MGSSESLPFSQIVSEISGVSQCQSFSGVNISSLHILNENSAVLSRLSYQNRTYPVTLADSIGEPFIPGSFDIKFTHQIGNMKMVLSSEPTLSVDLPLSKTLGTSLLFSKEPAPTINLSLQKIGKICSDCSLNLSTEDNGISSNIITNATFALMNNLYLGGLLSHSIRKPDENAFQGAVLARFGLASTGLFLTSKSFEMTSSFGLNFPIFITRKNALEFGFSTVYLRNIKSDISLLNLFAGTKYYLKNQYEIQSGISFGHEFKISSLFSCALKPDVNLSLSGSYNLLDQGLNVGLHLNLITSSIDISN